MKLIVCKGFVDKDTQIFHHPDEVIEYPEARAKEIESRGFGKCIDEPKPTVKKEKAKAEPEKETKTKKAKK